MVFGELVPKNIAIAEPMDTAKAVITPTRISTMIFTPLIVVLNGVANAVLRMIGIEPQEELRSARSAVELDSLVRRSAAQGTFEAPTAGLLARSIAFSGKTADDVLTPRVRVRFVQGAAGGRRHRRGRARPGIPGSRCPAPTPTTWSAGAPQTGGRHPARRNGPR